MKYKNLNIKRIGIFQKTAYLLFFILVISSCSPTKYLKEDEYFFEGYKIEADDKKVLDYSPQDYVKQKPNKKIMGLDIYPYASIYNMVDPVKQEKREEKWQPGEEEMNRKRLEKGKEPKEKFRWTRWLRKIGEAPVIYNSVQTHKASQQITSLLKNKGYFNAKTTDSTKLDKIKKKASVKYKIKAGTPYTINDYKDSIIDPEVAKLLQSYFKTSQIRRGENVDVSYFDVERQKITDLMLENGYYRFSKEYIFFEIDTFLNNHQANVLITVKSPVNTDDNGNKSVGNHQKYKFKDMNIYPDFLPASVIENNDNKIITYDTSMGRNNIKFLISKKNKYTKAVLTRGLTINTDSIYRSSKAKGSFNYYSSLSNFRLINFEMTEPKLNENSSDTGYHYLNTNIKLTPLIPQSYSIELEGNYTGGKYGMATNLVYQQLNLFGGAEILDLKFKLELNNQEPGLASSSNYFSETEVGGNATIRFPNFLMPFSSRSFYLRNFPKTAFSLGYNFRFNSSYKRAIFSTTYGYEWRSNNTMTHQLNPIEFSSVVLSNVDSAYLADLRANGQLVEKYDHMIIGGSYTFTHNTQDIKKNQNFHFFRLKVEFSGNIINAFRKASNAPKLGYGDYQKEIIKQEIKDSATVVATIDTLNKNYPSFYTIGNIPYAQYFKTELDYRYYQILGSKNQLVYRISPGVIIPYGNSFYSPQERRFFLGGASSMRAWPARSLGPGTYKDKSDIYQYGDVKLEMNLEYRFKMFWMVDGALFVDAGNIWSLSQKDTIDSKKFKMNSFYRELGIGTGFGLRLDFSFFVFRFDFGIKLRDPSIPEGNSKWLGMSAFDHEQWTFNFGIGYPF